MSVNTISFKIIKALSDSGVFTHGGVLVGTHAFIAIGNLLGMRMENRWTMTSDSDFAGEEVGVASARGVQAISIPNILDALNISMFKLEYPNILT